MQEIHWREVCGVDDIQIEDMRELEIAGSLYLVYRTSSGYYASSGLCTHEGVRLADGLILGELIECPRHQGRFHIPTGQAKRVPARKSLATYPTKVEAGRVYIGLPTMEQRSPTQ